MQIKFKINGQNWKIKTVTAAEMRAERSDGEFAGLCVADERMIYIDEDSIEYKTVAHEIYHAYFHYLHLGDTNELTVGDYEEITASWFSDNAEEVIKKAKQLTKGLQKGAE